MQKVLVADDHPLYREAMRDMLGRLFDARGWEFVCLEATTSQELFDTVKREDDLDLILLDLFMPGSSGLADLVTLRDSMPATPIVVVSALEDLSVINRSIACGAASYIVKSSPKERMMQVLQRVMDEGFCPPCPDMTVGIVKSADQEAPLSPRQLAVLALLAKGRSNKQIARDLDISDVTVKAHMTAILRKLGVSTRAEAIVAFQKVGGHAGHGQIMM